MSLRARDHQVIWHPFTQHQISPLPLPIASGKGAYLIDENGKQYLDLISSWWVNLHGHAQPDIAKAIYEQAMALEHVIFAGFTHEPAVAYAEKLLQLLPPAFSKVFYSDNGSTAVEVALKMAYQYWRNIGEPKRTRFIAFEKSYHGDTFGAMSVGKASGFFGQFQDLLFSVDLFPYPATGLQDQEIEQKETTILENMSQFLLKHGHETAALIIEPLVQGAGGMQMCRPEFLQKLEVLIRAYGIIIIYDEVMTGFGRTGEDFACIKAETTPDIICLAKGMTGGFLPLAATVCQEKIYQAFLDDSVAKALIHGHSYSANPLGCAAALASLTLLENSKPQRVTIESVHQKYLSNIKSVQNPRICGTIAAFNLKLGGYGSQASVKLQQYFTQQGLLIRLLGDVIYFLPPYCITEAELSHAYEQVLQHIEEVCG